DRQLSDRSGEENWLQRWHRAEFARALGRSEWFGAAFHLEKLSKRSTATAELGALQAEHEAARPASALEAYQVRAKELQGRIPPRSGTETEKLIDLSEFYNETLTEEINYGSWQDVNTISDLPRGNQILAGTQFDIRGLISIRGRQLELINSYRVPER